MKDFINNYIPPTSDHWTGRTSDFQEYIYQRVQLFDFTEENKIPKAKEPSYALIGYGSDVGTYKNQGRTGAADGADLIKKSFGKLADHFETNVSIIDFGTFIPVNKSLEETQTITSNKIIELADLKYNTILLGGSHDLAYAHYSGLKKNYSEHKIGIINFDAHFDLRPVKNEPNSGTPFYQISREFSDFQYLCLGIQEASNPKSLFDYAQKMQVKHILNTDFHISYFLQVSEIILGFINKADYIYITVDLDGFSSSLAPGVSAPSPFGFQTDIFIKCLELICNSKKVIGFDLAEFNPKYDIDQRTANLAARILHTFITNHSRNLPRF